VVPGRSAHRSAVDGRTARDAPKKCLPVILQGVRGRALHGGEESAGSVCDRKPTIMCCDTPMPSIAQFPRAPLPPSPSLSLTRLTCSAIPQQRSLPRCPISNLSPHHRMQAIACGPMSTGVLTSRIPIAFLQRFADGLQRGLYADIDVKLDGSPCRGVCMRAKAHRGRGQKYWYHSIGFKIPTAEQGTRQRRHTTDETASPCLLSPPAPTSLSGAYGGQCIQSTTIEGRIPKLSGDLCIRHWYAERRSSSRPSPCKGRRGRHRRGCFMGPSPFPLPLPPSPLPSVD